MLRIKILHPCRESSNITSWIPTNLVEWAKWYLLLFGWIQWIHTCQEDATSASFNENDSSHHCWSIFLSTNELIDSYIGMLPYQTGRVLYTDEDQLLPKCHSRPRGISGLFTYVFFISLPLVLFAAGIKHISKTFYCKFGSKQTCSYFCVISIYKM